MELTKKEIARLTKNLKGYYMGEVVPPVEALLGYYDKEWWYEGNTPCTMYRDGHGCIECNVEYIHDPKSYLGENVFVAHVVIYIEGGRFCRKTEYWDARHVAMFTNEIEITM